MANYDQQDRNDADRQEHQDHWEREKRESGSWLSQSDYEKKTGNKGRR